VPEQPLPHAPRPPSRNPYNLPDPPLEKLKIAMDFVRTLHGVKFADDSTLPKFLKDQIENPLKEHFKIDDPMERFSLDLYLSMSGASRDTYKSVCAAIKRFHPDDNLCSYETITTRIQKWTGISLIKHDMCINNCYGFTGPLAELEVCPHPGCREPRYAVVRRSHKDVRTARKYFWQIPIAAQIQARWNSMTNGKQMKYAYQQMEQNLAIARANGNVSPKFFDIYCGTDILKHFAAGNVESHDTLLMFAVDGAQLYRDKKSDTLIGNWTIMNLPPHLRYKKNAAMPAFIVPGPGKAKHIESFMYPSFAEARILGDHGLKIWDGSLEPERRLQTSYVHPILSGADAVAMAQVFGSTGHVGYRSCRENCPVGGRLMPMGSTYYPALQKPHGYARGKGSHEDVNIEDIISFMPNQDSYLNDLTTVLKSRNQTEYEENRLKSGLTGVSLLLGLNPKRTLGVPGSLVQDEMHVFAINAFEELMALYRGVLTCNDRDDKATWDWCHDFCVSQNFKKHGERVDGFRWRVPSWAGRPPQNPFKKLSSGWKAIEALIYFFGMCPLLFEEYLPEEYYQHYCKLVRIFEILQQDTITSEDHDELTTLVIEYAEGIETLFVQRQAYRVHFVRPWIHSLLHMPAEVARIGPLSYYAQWTLERLIGLLEDDLRLHSDPYANIAHIAQRMCSRNALISMMPELGPPARQLTSADLNVGEGYALLHPCDKVDQLLTPDEVRAVQVFAEERWNEGDQFDSHRAVRYQRLATPAGPVTRSTLKENRMPAGHLQSSRMVEVSSSCHSVRC
jgi:hypothetical protein